MELRLRAARTTKDIDISLPSEAAAELGGKILAQLQDSGGTDLGDFFSFAIAEPQMALSCSWMFLIFAMVSLRQQQLCVIPAAFPAEHFHDEFVIRSLWQS